MRHPYHLTPAQEQAGRDVAMTRRHIAPPRVWLEPGKVYAFEFKGERGLIDNLLVSWGGMGNLPFAALTGNLRDYLDTLFLEPKT